MMEKITAADDVTEEMLDVFWEIVQGWYSDTKIDWDDVFARVEHCSNWDFGSEWDTPAIRKIKREMKTRKREV